MIKELLGSKGLVYLTIKNADHQSNGWCELSYQDIADLAVHVRLDNVKHTTQKLLNLGLVQKRKQSAGRKNLWRINPMLDDVLKNLFKENYTFKG